MNPRTRRVALHAIAAIAVLASLNALAHSYAGLYQWAAHHHLAGWQAVTWPAEIDVFLIIGELALYVAYLDGWTVRHKLWPWVTALVGLTVSVAGNIGHIPAEPGAPVLTVDRLTAATSPLAAFAGLAIALLVLKQTRSAPAQRPQWRGSTSRRMPHVSRGEFRLPTPVTPVTMPLRTSSPREAAYLNAVLPYSNRPEPGPSGESSVVRAAQQLRAEYDQRGTRLSRRQLAAQLRARGYTISNARIPEIAVEIGIP